MQTDFRISFLQLLAAVSSVAPASAFYIPGYSVHAYHTGDALPLYTNKIYSSQTQVSYAYNELALVCPASGSPHGGVQSGSHKPLNLGEVLRGDRIVASDYDLTVGQDVECAFLCSKELSRRDVAHARELVGEGYVAEWIVDNLPGATSFVTVDRSDKYYAAGFKVGFTDVSPATGHKRFFLNNHVTLVLRWRAAPGRAGGNGGRVIVGFEVYTKSVAAGTSRNATGCPRDVHHVSDGLELYIAPNNTLLASQYPDSSYLPESDAEDDGSTLNVPYSYSVYWREDTRIEWTHRWDLYFRKESSGSAIHWLAVVNALVISGLLTAVVVVVYGRTVRGDKGSGIVSMEEKGKAIRRKRPVASGARSPKPKSSTEKPRMSGLLDDGEGANDDDLLLSDDEAIEDASGYKLLHADVFRPPPYAGLLAPLVGSGTQLAFMAAGLLLLSCCGVLNPSWRGGFVSVGVGLFVFAGIFAGYFSSRVYKTFGGVNWRKNTLLTALLFPGFLFSTLFTLNLLLWALASSTALPFSTLVALLCLWLLIQLPLVYAGSFVGYHYAAAYTHPTQTSAVPRPIPNNTSALPWSAAPASRHASTSARQPGLVATLLGSSRSLTALALAGLPPFAVLFVELLFLFRTLWLDKSGFYYSFGHLALVAGLALLAVVCCSVLATHLLLAAEDHRWWWHSFAVGPASAAWIFAYCVWYFLFQTRIDGFVSAILFFAYSGMACAVWALASGTVAFLVAYGFVRRIYGNVKAD